MIGSQISGDNCEVVDWLFSERRVLVLRNNYTELLAPRRYAMTILSMSTIYYKPVNNSR